MSYAENRHNRGSLKSQILLGLILAISALVVALVLWWFRENTVTQNSHRIAEETLDNTQIEKGIEQKNSSETTPQPPQLFDGKVLQSVLDNWLAKQPGISGVTIMNLDGKVLANLNQDRKFFTASIYKIFVAYAGYIQLDNGTIDPGEMYINGHTRGECLDLMIRESDSPCAEKLLNEIGKSILTHQLVSYGMSDTSMTAQNTTSYDVAVILRRIATGEGLSETSQTALLQSMKTQVYRDALNAGFSNDVIVYNKIGFNEYNEYHDTAIVEFKDGRKLILSVLTDGVGTKNVADLGSLIELATH